MSLLDQVDPLDNQISIYKLNELGLQPGMYCSRDLNRHGIYHIKTVQDPTMDEIIMALSLVKNDKLYGHI